MNNLALSEETSISPSEVFLNGESMIEQDLEKDCQAIISRLHETGDTQEIENAVKNLNGVEKFAARAKSKLIFEWSVWYKDTNPEGNFAEWYVQTHGGDELTVKKHQAVGELLLSDEVPENVKQLPNKELVSVARAVQSGYDFTDCWDEIANAGSEQEVNAVVHRVKGTPERNGTLNITIDSTGTIMGWMDKEYVNIGWLNFEDRDSPETSDAKHKILQTAISRIVNNSRMKEKK